MSKINLSSNPAGNGIFTIASPNSNTDRTLTLPDVSGTVLVSGQPMAFSAGSTTTASVYPEGDPNTGVYFPASDTVGLVTNGVERMRIDSAGRVTTPAQPVFCARHNATEAPAANAPLTAWTVDLNQGGGTFSSGRYTVPAAGNYLITVSLLQNQSTGGGGIFLTKNGSTVTRLLYSTGQTSIYNMASSTYIASLAASDWLEFRQEVASVSWYGDAAGLGGLTINMIG